MSLSITLGSTGALSPALVSGSGNPVYAATVQLALEALDRLDGPSSLAWDQETITAFEDWALDRGLAYTIDATLGAEEALIEPYEVFEALLEESSRSDEVRHVLAEKETVGAADAQIALRAVGFYEGTMTLVWDQKTVDALAAWATARGIRYEILAPLGAEDAFIEPGGPEGVYGALFLESTAAPNAERLALAREEAGVEVEDLGLSPRSGAGWIAGILAVATALGAGYYYYKSR